jgi:hypothetical protein
LGARVAQPDLGNAFSRSAAAAQPQLFDRPFDRFLHGNAGLYQPRAVPSLLHDLRGYPDKHDRRIAGGTRCRQLGRIPRTRADQPTLSAADVALGLTAQSFVAWQMGQLNLYLTSFDVFWTSALQGFGFGLASTPMTVLAFATLPAGQRTEASGVFTLVRNSGSSLFISVSSCCWCGRLPPVIGACSSSSTHSTQC